jgi:hypothetical protein
LAEIDLMSAWMPAPPDGSEPAMEECSGSFAGLLDFSFQAVGGVTRIGRASDCRDNAEALCTGFKGLGCVAVLDAANGDGWNLGLRDQAGQAVEADGRVVVGLGGGGEHRADADMIDESGVGQGGRVGTG